jgi:hypothetical protein
MTAALLATARRYVLPRPLADEILTAIRAHGSQGAELFVALTATVEQGATVHFRRALVPAQTAHTLPEGLLVTIDSEALFALNRDCYENGELLAGQIHAHPDRAYHSRADDLLALVRLPGGLSIVVPHFGRGRLAPRRWSVNRLGDDGAWRRLPRRAKLELT